MLGRVLAGYDIPAGKQVTIDSACVVCRRPWKLTGVAPTLAGEPGQFAVAESGDSVPSTAATHPPFSDGDDPGDRRGPPDSTKSGGCPAHGTPMFDRWQRTQARTAVCSHPCPIVCAAEHPSGGATTPTMLWEAARAVSRAWHAEYHCCAASQGRVRGHEPKCPLIALDVALGLLLRV